MSSATFHSIPDGEYDLEISETLQSLLFAKSPTFNNNRAKNNEVLSIAFEDPSNQYGIDLTKPFTLTREQGEDTFTMNTESTKLQRGATFKGHIKANKALKSILVFNPASGVFELQQIENELSTLEINETQEETKVDDLPQQRTTPPQVKSPLNNNSVSLKKRVHKEPSIFQPKSRARTPSQGASSLPKPKKLTRENSSCGDPSSPPATILEKPLTPLNMAAERNITPSALTQHISTSSGTVVACKNPEIVLSSEISQNPKKSTTSKKQPIKTTKTVEAKATLPEALTKTFPSIPDKRPRMAQFASKKPPSASTSAVTTPVHMSSVESPVKISIDEAVSDKGEEVSDGELDDLVGELEEEMEEEEEEEDDDNELKFDDFDQDKQADFITVEEEVPMSLDFHFGDDDDLIINKDNSNNSNGGIAKKRPISFRDLVGDYDDKQDEDALTSSSEEE